MAKRKKAKSKSLISKETRVLLCLLVFLVTFGLTLAFLLKFNFLNIAGTNPVQKTSSNESTQVYSGVTPCADCEGIKTTLTLNPDYTYTLTLDYLGQNVEPYTQKGMWSSQPWKNNPSKTIYVLTPDQQNAGLTEYEILSSTQIRQLDGEGNPIPESMPFTLTLQK